MNSRPQPHDPNPIRLDAAQEHCLVLNLRQLESDLYAYADFLDDAVDGDVVQQISELSRRAPALNLEDLLLLRRVERAVQRLRTMQAGVDQAYERIADVLGLPH